jgi:hypothetical protein
MPSSAQLPECKGTRSMSESGGSSPPEAPSELSQDPVTKYIYCG